MNSFLRRTLKTTSTAAMAAGLLAAGAAAASAHVHVDPDDTAAGGYTHLTFNVPNESDTAKTNKLEVALPAGTPFNSVSVKPVEGWTARVITGALPKPVTVDGATVTKAPRSIVWTADAAHQIGPNEYQSFSISVGVLPDAGTTVTLPATQSYTDGTVVKWDQNAVEGQEEPEHPAPSFVTTAAEEAGHHAAPSPSATVAPSAAPAAAAASTDGGSTAGWFGLGAGLIGLGAGVTALARTRASKG
ncbi:YcnI family protein [Arthrobacter celericrescens]|uniref:YcnI family copper-binding membrane protein n=1 Tax=Arthrobacter celericrescens TaxID=2320851 RepID=UPI000EA35FBA|nr:YcnI family protein [Arthrobacter celericrescens]